MIAKATRLYRDSKKKRVKRLAEELRKKREEIRKKRDAKKKESISSWAKEASKKAREKLKKAASKTRGRKKPPKVTQVKDLDGLDINSEIKPPAKSIMKHPKMRKYTKKARTL